LAENEKRLPLPLDAHCMECNNKDFYLKIICCELGRNIINLVNFHAPLPAMIIDNKNIYKYNVIMISRKRIKNTTNLFTSYEKNVCALCLLLFIATVPLYAGKLSDNTLSRKVHIIPNNEELPKNHHIKIEKKTPQIVIIPYVDKENIYIDNLPDYNAPLLSDKIGVSDSIEPFNRAMFKVDDFLFVYLISPISKGYNFIVPQYFRKGISRMDYNIEMPKRSFNNLLQAKWKGAGISFSRFLVNSTIGLAGFYDPAKAWFGWEKYDEDFGQTLATWGVAPGSYVYIPLLGSYTVRDGLASILDMAMDPRNALIITPVYGVTVFMKFNNITLKIDVIEQLRESYYDTYSLKRDFWYMKRTADIAK